MITPQEMKGYSLFSGLAENELIGIVNLCRRLAYDINMVIFDPDHPSENIFLVADENEAIQIEIPIIDHADKIIIHTLSKGEVFGWTALGTQHVRTATARCLRPVKLIAINVKSLMQLLEKNHHTGYIVMKNLVDIINTRLSYTTVAFRHEIRIARGKLKVAVT